jgi:hypothetical protein
MVTISARDTNIYKTCKLHKAILSVPYNISLPNFAVLLIFTSLREFTFLRKSNISLTCKFSIFPKIKEILSKVKYVYPVLDLRSARGGGWG